MSLAELFVQTGPAMRAQFFPVLLVLRIYDDRRVAAFQNEVRQEIFLRAQVGWFPAQRCEGLASPAGTQEAAYPSDNTAHDGFHPCLEERFQRHRPRESF